MNKIAFLFLTKGDSNVSNIWKYYFKDISTNLYNIYCHPKKKPSQLFLKKNVIQTIIPTQWGDISLVKATILLLREAFKDENNKFFILVSESCCPVQSFKKLYDKIFSIKKSWIYYQHHDNRYDRYLKMDKKLKYIIPFNRFLSQNQWMVLSRLHTSIILKNTDKLSLFKNVHAIDEHYFILILLLYYKNMDNLSCVVYNQKITYCDWSDIRSSHPKEFKYLEASTLKKAIVANCFFIRKISSDCKVYKEIIFLLDKK